MTMYKDFKMLIIAYMKPEIAFNTLHALYSIESVSFYLSFDFNTFLYIK